MGSDTRNPHLDYPCGYQNPIRAPLTLAVDGTHFDSADIIYIDSPLSDQESIDMECGDLSPLCVGWKRKRRQVAALQMVLALITPIYVQFL